MTFEIKEGGFYVNRYGEKIGPVTFNTHGEFMHTHPWRIGKLTFTANGEYSSAVTKCDDDLIAEWTAPAVEPEWGEWLDKCPDGHDLAADYQFQRVNGKGQFRIRKAPPAPVVTTVTGRFFWMDHDCAAAVDLVDGKPDWSTLRVQP